MKNKYCVSFLLILFLLCSCEIEGTSGPLDEDTANRALCRYFWLEAFEGGPASTSRQFIFEVDGTGMERSQFGLSSIHDVSFRWEWLDASHRTILLHYGDTKVLMEEIFIMDNALFCRMEGALKTFKGVHDYL